LEYLADAEAETPLVARGWSALLVIACLTTLWIALTFKLIAFSVNY
jgi:hypothetical protein